MIETMNAIGAALAKAKESRAYNEYRLTVTYQPMNKCWGVKVKKGNIVANLVDENLLTALQQMGVYILQVRNQNDKK